MYRKKSLIFFGSVIVYMIIILLFIYKSSQDLKRNKLLPISKLEYSSENTKNYNKPIRMVTKIFHLIIT